MTQNQIAYWNLQETKRANEAKEGQLVRELEETKRSNLAKEAETSRTNKVQEQLKQTDINSQVKYRQDQTQIGMGKVLVDAANVATGLFKIGGKK